MSAVLQPVFLLFALGFPATVAVNIIYAQIGENVSLVLPSYQKKYQFFWYKEQNEQIVSLNIYEKQTTGKGWETRLTAKPSSLLIKNLTSADFNVLFSCQVVDKLTNIDAPHEFRLIQLNVAVEPPVVLPGETLSLTCATVGPDHAPQIRWVGPQEQRTGGTTTVQASSVHSGQWECDVGSKRRVQKKVTVIDLRTPPSDPTLYTSALNPLTVPCSLTADSTWDLVKSKGVLEVGWNFCPAKPQCDKSDLLRLSPEDPPTWKRLTDRAPWPSPDPGSGNWSLGRKLAREEDGGDYECFVRFQNVILNRTVRVEVLRIVAEPGTELKMGQQLNLTCTTARPLPPGLSVEWLPPAPPPSSSSSSSSLDLESARLSFGSVRSLHNGTWRCQLLRGQAVLTSAEVLLNIEPQWSVWKVVTLCAAAAILILLMILVVILYRRRQRRTRRHKRLCKCKNPKPKGFYRS